MIKKRPCIDVDQLFLVISLFGFFLLDGLFDIDKGTADGNVQFPIKGLS